MLPSWQIPTDFDGVFSSWATPPRHLTAEPAPTATIGWMEALRGSRSLLCALLLACASALAGCGSSSSESDAPPGMTISAPGLQGGQPPWRPEYRHLRQRIAQLGLPPAGTERFHIHALLRIYVDGILVPIPRNIGIDESRDIYPSLHTHDSTGIIHMESTHPHRFTLGDFFAVWGVKLGPDRLGGLTGERLHFFLNGRRLRDPAAYEMRNDDNIVIGYGALDSFPHEPGVELLRALRAGTLGCSNKRDGRRATSCFAPRARSGDDQG